MKQNKGFTLIELLIVVAIIAILAAIAVPNFLEAQVRSKVSRSKSDMRSIATALESYRVDNNKYCPCDKGRDGSFIANLTPVNPRVQRLAWVTTPIAYMSSIPNDPFAPGKTEPNVTVSDKINKSHPIYVYWDERYADAFKASATTGPSMNPDLSTERAARGYWALISYGPDRDFEPAVAWPPPYLGVYDPTNGTVSNGDVWRFGATGVR